MIRPLRGIVLAALLCAPALARAQHEALVGPEQFPEFRNLSGLAGSGYGTDWQGHPSMSGPIALSSPVAYVLGHNHVHVVAGFMSNDSTPRFSESEANGTITGTYGATLGPVNIAITDMVLNTSKFSQSFHIQLQYVPQVESPMALSIGVQDLRGGGGSAGEGFGAAEQRTSRSFFVVGTWRVPKSRNPLFISGGGGTRRFAHGFASVSYQVIQPVRAFVEYDGFGANEGLLFTWMSRDRRPIELNAGVSLVKSRYLTLFAGIGF